MTTAEQIIELFGMKPLPGEGGYYVETYRCTHKIASPHPPPGAGADRSLSSAILYLLTPDTFSALHRLKYDEVFHFYLGDPVTMLRLNPDGSAETITLGGDILQGQRLQVVVPARTWQGCILNPGGRFALMGTTIAPAFDFADLELADRKTLISQYPARAEMITRLTSTP
ncbi:MAG: cupin domain-containing protein [Sedimentisphaerales bacterium]|nr:cupin domain-containing protein [Sedimentisphaerales bacterium]